MSEDSVHKGHCFDYFADRLIIRCVIPLFSDPRVKSLKDEVAKLGANIRAAKAAGKDKVTCSAVVFVVAVYFDVPFVLTIAGKVTDVEAQTGRGF